MEKRWRVTTASVRRSSSQSECSSPVSLDGDAVDGAAVPVAVADRALREECAGSKSMHSEVCWQMSLASSVKTCLTSSTMAKPQRIGPRCSSEEPTDRRAAH